MKVGENFVLSKSKKNLSKLDNIDLLKANTLNFRCSWTINNVENDGLKEELHNSLKNRFNQVDFYSPIPKNFPITLEIAYPS